MSVRSGGPEGQTVSLSSGGLWPWDGRPIRGAGGYRSFLSSQLVASVIASGDELFYFTANLVVHAFCCFSPLNCNRCAGLRPGRGNDSRGRLRTVLPYHFLSPSESSCSECIIGEQTHIFYAWVIVYGKAHVETISHLDCLYRSSRRPLQMADPGMAPKPIWQQWNSLLCHRPASCSQLSGPFYLHSWVSVPPGSTPHRRPGHVPTVCCFSLFSWRSTFSGALSSSISRTLALRLSG